MVETEHHHPDEPWPEAISDGLSLSCAICRKRVHFDYKIDDRSWRRLVPPDLRAGVICLPCLDWLAHENDVAYRLEEIQFTGIGKTVVLQPSRAVRYETYAGRRKR